MSVNRLHDKGIHFDGRLSEFTKDPGLIMKVILCAGGHYMLARKCERGSLDVDCDRELCLGAEALLCEN